MDFLKNIFPEKVYEVKSKCSNCNTKQLTKIKKGNKASEVIENGHCEKCGCLTLSLQD